MSKPTAAMLKAMGITRAQWDAIAAAMGSGTENGTPESVPYLSCWNASRVKVGKDGTFSHKPKSGTEKQYRTLTRDEAVALLDENIAAGRVYAVKA